MLSRNWRDGSSFQESGCSCVAISSVTNRRPC
jgi:hypothetical protein